MKKKFFAMYALVGALVASPVFTSCIDGEESESVTAVRNERAAAIKAKIAMEQAEADRQAQLKELELAKDMANYEQQKAMYEKYLLDYQLQIEKAKAELKAYQETTLSELTDAYTNALSNVAAAEWNVVKYNQQIAQINAGYADALEALKEDIAEKNEDIVELQAKIEKLKKLQEEGVDETALEATKKELKAIQDKAFKDYKELQLQYGIKPNLIGDNHYMINAKALEVIKAITFFQEKSLYVYTTDKDDLYVLDNSEVLAQQRQFADDFKQYTDALDEAIAALGTEKDTEKTTISAENDDLTAYANLARATKQMEAADALLAKLEKALTDAKTALAADEDNTTLQQDVIDAQNALKDFKNDTTDDTYNHDGDEEGVEDAGYKFAETELANAEMALATAKDNVIDYEKELARVSETSTQFEEYLKVFEGEAYEAYKTAVAELEAAKDTYVTAKAEYDAVERLYNNIDTTSSGVSGKTFDEAIAMYEAEIESINAEIKELSASFKSFDEDLIVYNNDGNYWYIDTINVTVNSEEVLAGTIAYLEKKVAIEEAKLVALNKVLEEAKAALDAYLAE